MRRRTKEFAGLMALVILATANFDQLEKAAASTGRAVVTVANVWHRLVVGAGRTSTDVNVEAGAHHYASMTRDAYDAVDDLDLRKASLYAWLEAEEDAGRRISFLTAIALRPFETDFAVHAVHLLGNESGGAALEALGLIAGSGTFARTRKAAVWAIANVLSDDAAPRDQSSALSRLADVASADPSTDVRKAAVHAIGQVDAPAARAVLLDLIAGTNS